ncbi:MAG: DNA translocase FtsK 4TM domain-containing protein [Succiniclasticum sp.]|jgi:S-DNA-T family DNA segregation ATPase FtsK/SpoIIIE
MTTKKRTTREPGKTVVSRPEEYELHMAKKRRNKRIKGVILLILALLCLFSYFGVVKGSLGSLLADFLRYGFGLGALAVPLFLLAFGYGFAVSQRNYLTSRGFWILLAGFLCLLGLLQHAFVPADDLFTPHLLPEGGGLAGALLLSVLRKALGVTGASVVVIAGLLASLFGTAWNLGLFRKERKGEEEPLEEDVPRPAEEQPEAERRRPAAGNRQTHLPSLFTRSQRKEEMPRRTSLDVYQDEEFSEFNKGLRKKSAFKRILDFGHRLTTGEEAEEDGYVSRPAGERWQPTSQTPVPPEQAAPAVRDHADEPGTRPEMSTIYPEAQETVVLRPRSVDQPNQEEGPDSLPTEEPLKEAGSVLKPFPVQQDEDNAMRIARAATEEAALPGETAPEQGQGSAADAAADHGPGRTDAANPGTTTPVAGAVPDEEGKADGGDEKPSAPAYVFPPLSLLEESVKTDPRNYQEEIAEKVRILEQTLADFKVNAKVVHATRGPSVTRFELHPAPGVKVSSVVNLADDIALRLAAPGVRVEAPIPGKAAIGIEAPNATNDPVKFREVVDNEAVRKDPSKLCVGLGRDISGNIITIDLAKMPHLLIAGSTGSGKSVCVNTLIAGILYKARPDEVKLILVDPKVVELTNYNGIPHLLVPVVTDAKKAASALHWAVAEMERRYQSFADNHVRDIRAYNEQAKEKMPFIVIVIDEMSDLMMVAKADVEDAILRLAQKARACGIHLVLATQRPSVDVITGIVKANIPSRIAFAVASLTDSRTILDMGGAEKLLGKGDMLFSPIGTNKPLRVQGAFVSDAELNRITEFIKNQAIPVEYSDEVTSVELPSDSHGNKASEGGDVAADEQDELLDDAIRVVLEQGQASASMLQRRFRVGYNRAARLVDTMEELGIVGPAVGSKPRELKMSPQQVEQLYLRQGDDDDNGI